MIDICTWRARIGLYRAVRVGPSGRTRAKVLLASSADGVEDWREDWSLLLALITIMMELVVTVLIIIPLLVLLANTTARYYCFQKTSATLLVNHGLLYETGK